jgi:NifU-like protein involved in Fe-S cluster formation
MTDIKKNKKNWFYSDIIKKHFLEPKNVAFDDKIIEKLKPNGIGIAGSPACGDLMHVWIKVNDEMKIEKCLWRTFGCASAIASTSVMSEMVENMTINEAKKLTPKEIAKKLGGLPQIKVHCSVLGTQALKKAIENYEN